MRKIWNFSTLQRPTQEEKERKRRFLEDQQRQQAEHGQLLRVGRAKTFRHLVAAPGSAVRPPHPHEVAANFPVSPANVLVSDAHRHRAKSASRALEKRRDQLRQHRETGEIYNRRYRKQNWQEEAHSAGSSRLRFLESDVIADEERRLREPMEDKDYYVQDFSHSSGYSSGGKNDYYGAISTLNTRGRGASNPRSRGPREDDVFDLYATPLKMGQTSSAVPSTKEPAERDTFDDGFGDDNER